LERELTADFPCYILYAKARIGNASIINCHVTASEATTASTCVYKYTFM